MSLREMINLELRDEFRIEGIQIEKNVNHGRPGTTVTISRNGGLLNEWFFSEVNKMTAEEMVGVMRSYLANDKRLVDA